MHTYAKALASSGRTVGIRATQTALGVGAAVALASGRAIGVGARQTGAVRATKT